MKLDLLLLHLAAPLLLAGSPLPAPSDTPGSDTVAAAASDASTAAGTPPAPGDPTTAPPAGESPPRRKQHAKRPRTGVDFCRYNRGRWFFGSTYYVLNVQLHGTGEQQAIQRALPALCKVRDWKPSGAGGDEYREELRTQLMSFRAACPVGSVEKAVNGVIRDNEEAGRLTCREDKKLGLS